MSGIIDLIMSCGLYFGFGAMWCIVPTLVIFPLAHRLKKGVWSNPFCLIDTVTVVSVLVGWNLLVGLNLQHRGMAPLLDLFITGALFGVFSAIRSICIWKGPQWKFRISFLMLILTNAAMAFLVLTGITGSE